MIDWRSVEQKYGPDSLRGKVGNLTVFSIFWDVMVQADKEAPYTAKTELPGFKKQYCAARFKTTEDAKQWCEDFLSKWIKAAGLVHK